VYGPGADKVLHMDFSTLFTRLQRAAIASAGALVGAVLCAPTDTLAQEKTAALRSSDTKLLDSKQRLLPSKELKRGNAYAPVVWMPEGASVKLGDSNLAFGLARLNPLVRRSVGLSSGDVGAIAAPVMSMQVSPTSSVTVIKVMGDSSGLMLAWQLKL
jgi:hypothetical protein